jgi:RNA polymerase sigma-70 factor (ECF subfamily)
VDRDESDLVRKCLAGDQEACTALVEAYARLVGTIIWRATGDNRVVEDLAQEVFLRVFRALPSFDARAKLSTWIYPIAHRVAIDHLRQVNRRRPDSLFGSSDDGEPMGLDLLHASSVIDPEAIAIRDETVQLIRAGLADLPEKYRLPLVYAAIDGLDYHTIAVMLGVPVGTVKTLVFRGKQMLGRWVVAALNAHTAGQ